MLNILIYLLHFLLEVVRAGQRMTPEFLFIQKYNGKFDPPELISR
uniref:Uncharacterized protein n=1 Tax=Anguilla anguilla TaxID=7936 RepID=A0A0E9XRL1_ANGAN